MSTISQKELDEFRAEAAAWVKENAPANPVFMLPLTFMEVGTDAQFNFLREWQNKGAETEVAVVGKKAITFFKRLGDVEAEVSDLGDKPKMEDLIGSIKVMLDAYRDGKIDRLFLMGNEFVNTMTQRPEAQQLLPIPPTDDEELPEHWDYIYEPEAAELLDYILQRYVESQIYQGVVENVACEMAARMVAMKSASDNAGEIIEELELQYNKARQAAITQELSEIVAGAQAVS